MADRIINALQAVDFNWTTHINSIWKAPDYDVSDLHQRERAKLIAAAQQLQQANRRNSPLGQVVLGPPGAGKTHLLCAIRQQAMQRGIGFILVDMTDVRDFWETVLQGYISSLREDDEDGIPQFQLRRLIQSLINQTKYKTVTAKQMAHLDIDRLKKGLAAILTALNKQYPKEVARFQDVIRAIVLLNSEDFSLSDTGYSWLSGLEIDADDKQAFRFKSACKENLVEIVEGLSWLMSLQSPWILALDQLDSIVAQHHYATRMLAGDTSEEQQTSRQIIEGIGGGLMALRDKTARTQTVVSCLDVTWQVLTREVVKSFGDRFQKPMVLTEVVQRDIAAQLIAPRLRAAYQAHKFDPPSPTWPFAPSFFEDAARRGKLPRQILQRCDQHRQSCVSVQKITELTSFDEIGTAAVSTSDLTPVDQAFRSAQQRVDVLTACEEIHEDDILGQWLQTVAYCLVQENPTSDAVDPAVDASFPGGKRYPQLHARVRLIYREEGDRERHLCLRGLLRSHHAAYSARLKAAIATAGIDRALSFRRLVLFRQSPPPGGAATQKLTDRFTKAGGLLVYPSQDELRTIGALHQLKLQNLPDFDRWLQQQRPASQLPSLQTAVAGFFDATEQPMPTPSADPAPSPSKPTQQNRLPQQPTTPSDYEQITLDQAPVQPEPVLDGHTAMRPHTAHPDAPGPDAPPKSVPLNHLPLGHRFPRRTHPVSIPLEALTKHTVILAGSGAGKTVLVRRLIEEAALQGIPSIVIDGANDLARMGDPWPTVPEVWTDTDRENAERYHQTVNVTVWTPGREAGNPVNLKPLPDFAALITNADELSQAVDMARDSLQDIVAAGKGKSDQINRGLLRSALDHFAHSGGGDLEYFAEYLRELPEAASGSISKAQKRAQDMADLLNAAISNNPLLRQRGVALDPAILFGLEANKTRISILNFIGLPGLPQQQQFLNQLAMTLFTWIKKNPAPAGVPLRGLLVIDEAKDFLPSLQTTACKSSLNRLAAQARKYGLGLIFATQAPKSIDHNVVANCSTQFYGRANSPSAIEVVRDQLRQRGGDGFDIAKLGRGQFYAVSESLTPPVKLLTPLCLSHHPSSPLDENAVLKRAQASRQ
ncbi:MAG: DUF87 domain-containing protein [Cyanobacteria bacterium J06628_6]